ncbi:MAG: BCD family MFS transporter [Bellilinea sp.]
MLRKSLQLALIHAAVAMTLVPINSTLNRVMIKELALSATLVAILASLPYLFSPTQVMIGSYADRHPLFGRRRTVYIAIGLALCVTGVILAPRAVFLMPENRTLGILFSLLTFGAWGMGYNFASVSYLSLASELSGEKGRSRTIAIMWFVMILGIIFTSIGLSRLLEPYSPERLENSFTIIAMIALALGAIGLIGLEPRYRHDDSTGPVTENRRPWGQLIREVMSYPSARNFFFYLILMLAAILGQDVLLEPFAGEAFGLRVEETTRITSIWGTCVLLTLALANPLEKKIGKKRVAQLGAVIAVAGFVLIALSGLLAVKAGFFSGVVLLGLGTGLATVSNLSLMLDMTTDQVGLFIGAWGVSNALARLLGTVLGGVLRDVVTQISANALVGYVVVFFVEAALLIVSLFLLRRIDTRQFRAYDAEFSAAERAALMNEAT